jgi:conjugal transfer pilus assembly protein TraE
VKLESARKTVRQIRLDNTVLKIGFGAILFMNALLGFKVATRDEAVILVPPFQHESIEFINGRANREFYSQWAWSTAMMAGNLTPGNAAFVRGELQRIATPDLYRKLMETLDIELQNIVRDNAVVTFSPREVVYDPELERFFVTGSQQISGPGVRKPIEKQITYELGFTTERLRVYLASYAVYDGKPMTAQIRDREIDRRAEDAAKASGDAQP